MSNPFDYSANNPYGQQPYQTYQQGSSSYGTPFGGGYDPYAGTRTNGQTNPFANDQAARSSYYSWSPSAAYGQFRNTLPGGFSNPFSRFLQQNYTPIYNQFQSDLANNPYQSFGDYLQRMNPQLQNEFSNLSPVQRGETPQLAGRVQYVGF